MQAQLESTLARLVAIKSVSADSPACYEIFNDTLSELTALGLHIVSSPAGTDHPWFFATTRQTLKPDVLLAAHLDVIPAPDELFTMRKSDGNLYGRGVYDMKLAAACYLEFFKAHANMLHELNIGVLFTTDEEAGGTSMNDIMATGLRPKVVFLPDGGDDWHVEKRAKGLYGVELTARGKTAHGSRPWEGENALHTLLDVLKELRAEFPAAGRSDSTLSVGTLHAGEAINQVPDKATVAIDFRSFSVDDLNKFKRLIDTFASTHQLEVREVNVGDPLLFDEQHPNVQSFLAALREHTGKQEIDYTESYGASDARYFSHYNIPCIVMEPRGGNRHADDEWLKASDLGDYYRLIERWLLSLKTTATPVTADRQLVAEV